MISWPLNCHNTEYSYEYVSLKPRLGPERASVFL